MRLFLINLLGSIWDLKFKGEAVVLHFQKLKVLFFAGGLRSDPPTLFTLTEIMQMKRRYKFLYKYILSDVEGFGFS